MTDSATTVGSQQPRLAYVSPLPPLRSGISDYSAQLLPELAAHYEVEVIVDQQSVADDWIREHCVVRDSQWLLEHADEYDRVLYHFGNSSCHQHMFGLLAEVPGVVMLHDFFLSGIIEHMDRIKMERGIWRRSLWRSHGWKAWLQSCFGTKRKQLMRLYPCNRDVVEAALGVIVHSEYSRRLARQWLPPLLAEGWEVLPLVRPPLTKLNRQESRRALGLADDDLLVCSFGMVGQTKMNDRLLEAWLASNLAQTSRGVLVFVGENDAGEYGKQLMKRICESGEEDRCRISGWAEPEIYQHYLAAADLAVQLRTRSRGESSAAVHDCMNAGTATIVNANGSLADLPEDQVYKLADDFTETQLVEALQLLAAQPALRQRYGDRARKQLHKHHHPKACAKAYVHAIEKAYA